MRDLKNKVVLITGASSGIGAALARAFGECGSRVAVHYRSGVSAAQSVVSQIKEAGGDAIAVQADITESSQVDEMVAKVHAHFGRIDVLVNNAGGFVRRAPIVEADDDYIDDVFRLNARSVVAVSRRVIPLMAGSGGGNIINVTTQAARTGGGPGAGLYAACKGFVSTITRTMAKELVGERIRVNAVAPGVIETPFHDGHSSPEILKRFSAAIPMGRLGTAEECTGAFLFLASDEASSYVTGQIIEVNGGQVMP
ncbi:MULTISPECIES: SDR family NAD(P)-dependent oxidoreductase [Paraburkholderia]|jgi:3-oxoacyl-[acyl-carrier protein] reductase|uniref:3-oxoacyl-ACP reductase n=1 Tax=Paraburkholderia hospita TaxID=169430 RepID=A0AAN1JL33_9BURK|nr:glucose 1-dehydrogenase [Paraburkholderia hospita]SKC95567.1 NAD(P)-dependent dehydrogenase, short-chain alcohol dehydrogenase family [Burkholderia sp. CF099]AUT74882.1 3-oxoacyl-ACP reductase [Paraburkholderia hospita]EIM94976.1 short-chain dehydrogenase/reductase SDR [Paraburkholderia hospita]OUL77497.1 oxidoreductase [Paraburkholderia hospita]OUL91903.1 oxidoreductase [Paraburkholderia hospita]